MISGAHVVIYSKDADADRAFLRDVLGFAHVDAGHGFLIFALPASEAAVHAGEANDRHELFLMCDDLEGTMARLGGHKVPFELPTDQPWGRLTFLTLPGGGRLGLYQPKHPRP